MYSLFGVLTEYIHFQYLRGYLIKRYNLEMRWIVISKERMSWLFGHSKDHSLRYPLFLSSSKHAFWWWLNCIPDCTMSSNMIKCLEKNVNFRSSLKSQNSSARVPGSLGCQVAISFHLCANCGGNNNTWRYIVYLCVLNTQVIYLLHVPGLWQCLKGCTIRSIKIALFLIIFKYLTLSISFISRVCRFSKSHFTLWPSV